MFKVGENVEYHNVPVGKWIKATVEHLHSDGRISLDVRKRADPSKVRRISAAATLVEQLTKKDEQIAKKDEDRTKQLLQEMNEA